jgi:gliding motility-associated-like protein
VEGSIEIFNRWGQRVYRSEKLDEGWDGFLAGKLQPEDVYVFTLQFSYTQFAGMFTRKGAFTLIR